MLKSPCKNRAGHARRSSPFDMIHQHGMPFVNATRNIGIPTRAEYRCGAGIRIHLGEIVRRKREATVVVIDGFGVVEEERALCFVERPLLSAKRYGAELEPRVHIGEENLSEAAVFEVEQAGQTSACRYGLEELRGRLVGVDARRSQQAHKPVRLDEASSPVRRTASKGYPPCAQERVSPCRTHEYAHGRSPVTHHLVLQCEFVPASCFARINAFRLAPVGARAISYVPVANHSTSGPVQFGPRAGCR